MIQQSPTEERAGCPFCGNSHVQLTSIRDGYEAWCKCGASMTAHNPDSRNKVIAKWNARAILASQAAQPAEADGVEREAGWTYEYDSGAGWETHVVLNTPPNLPTKRAPAKHYGSGEIRNVRPFYYAASTPKAPATDAGEVERIEAAAHALHELEDSWNDVAWQYLPEGTRKLFRAQATVAVSAALATPPAPNDDLRAENERLRVEVVNLRAALAELANGINIVGSPYHQAQQALDELTLQVKRQARAALKENRRG